MTKEPSNITTKHLQGVPPGRIVGPLLLSISVQIQTSLHFLYFYTISTSFQIDSIIKSLILYSCHFTQYKVTELNLKTLGIHLGGVLLYEEVTIYKQLVNLTQCFLGAGITIDMGKAFRD